MMWKTAEPQASRTSVGPMKHVLDAGPDPGARRCGLLSSYFRQWTVNIAELVDVKQQ